MPVGVYIRKPFNKKHRRNLSLSLLGHKVSEETRRKIKLYHKGTTGYHHTEETKRKIGLANKCHRHTEETKRKLRQTHL